jgi:hypothetical protein
MHPSWAASADWEPNSPVARLQGKINAQLDGGEIPVTCGHTEAPAYVLSLPSRVFLCVQCYSDADPKPGMSPGLCAACGAENAIKPTGWLRFTLPVTGVALGICGTCDGGKRILQTWS